MRKKASFMELLWLINETGIVVHLYLKTLMLGWIQTMSPAAVTEDKAIICPLVRELINTCKIALLKNRKKERETKIHFVFS